MVFRRLALRRGLPQRTFSCETLNCCGRPAANFAVVNMLGQLLQKTSMCCLYSQTGLLPEVLDVMVVAEEHEQVVQ